VVRAKQLASSRADRVKLVLYSSAVISIVTGTVAVLGAPYKW